MYQSLIQFNSLSPLHVGPILFSLTKMQPYLFTVGNGEKSKALFPPDAFQAEM